ncbi:MAG: hypothetical protein ACI9TI_000277 [Natronomonas sp.]|jgi:hypothetical protein
MTDDDTTSIGAATAPEDALSDLSGQVAVVTGSGPESDAE